MNRILLIILMVLGIVQQAVADHITGGEIFYTFAGTSNGQYLYNVTARLFMRCNSGREFNNPTIISVFDRTGNRYKDYSVPLQRIESLKMTNNDPCITNPPVVCYEVGYYYIQISVPGNLSGYTITAHVNFRIDGINNLAPNYDRIGATYIGEVPSTVNNAADNNSAHFTGEDLVVVCAENSFSYSFAAADSDGDELRYSFCNGYRTTGGGGFGNNVEPPNPPPYQSVPYGNGFSGSAPLGDKVSINPKTGLISGVAPPRGIYVVTVCVEEIRDGVVIATQHKDLQINIAPCSITAAALPDEFMLCGNTQTLTTKNNSTSPLINSYNWEFLDKDGTTIFESENDAVSYTFQDTGIYTIKLVINRNQQCTDSATAIARVYPGFEPDFSISSPCITRPAAFTDNTTSVLGTPNLWTWDFGDYTTTSDVSDDRNPVYAYTEKGLKDIRLIAGNTFGCRDTVIKTVDIFDKPPLQLAFRDTLICPPDELRLAATGSGSFSWAPEPSLRGNETSSPFVSPLTTTKYYVELDDDGCVNRDSVLVRVVNTVNVEIMNDAIICEGDTIGLNLSTNGLKFAWTPALTLNDASVQNPLARPAGTTRYDVTASISTCTASDFVMISTVPYPIANAGADTTICFNTAAQLNASTDGSSFNWISPAALSSTNILNPVAAPIGTSSYFFYAYDTKGCPKPGIDTVIVTVQPDIQAYAGNDTVIVIGQPLQMQATGGELYRWSPSIGLSATDISNPVAKFAATPAEGYHTYKVVVYDTNGCSDSASMQVKIFSSLPELYVPSAFTPNGDGRNDFFQLVAAGIMKVDAFHVYNRWGQMLFNAPNTHSRGWDGSYAGLPQPAGTYVWMVKARDYTGKVMLRKGTMVLIR